jgi:serine/threonine-protein kinase
MGEVWRARDTRLGRTVAIKTLPAQFATDADRLARFEREAKLLASLNHPNIASVYGFEAFAEWRFLVMELVDGETLAERLARGPLAVDEALSLALQMAEAIEAAHEKDVIHRDLKPANIKVTPDGKIKVLDFGLAKALQADANEVSAANSPTLSLAATAHGLILGTAAYMSPEQARGQAVDRRTDVWAFGCVLYEMLTGRPAFRGDMVSDILASVLAREPEFAELPSSIHPRLTAVLRRCLDKNPRRRWQAMGDLRVELEQILADPTSGTAPAVARTPQRTTIRAALPYVAAAAIVAAAAAWFLKPAPAAPPTPIVRFEFEVPRNQTFRSTGRPVVALSPDGRHFAYNTTSGVYLRSMDTLTSRVIPGTETAGAALFFSPDGEWLGYWSAVAQGLQKISIGGGAPVTIARTETNPYSATWGRDGQILFTQGEGIMRVSSDGGTPELIIKSTGNEAMHGASLLPDGETILYARTRVNGPARWDQAEVVAHKPGSDPKVLIRGASDAMYASSGHLVYALGNVLYAVAFDAAALETRSGPVPVVTGVQRAAAPSVNSGSANFGLSAAGALVYLNSVTAAATPESTLGIVTREGTVRALEVPKANYRSPRVSPDGRRIAVETITEAGQGVIWVYDLGGQVAMRRLTQDGSNTRPVWSADGRYIAYGSDRDKKPGIFWQLADGSGLPERLTTAEDGYEHFPESFSRDGRVLSFANVRPPLGANSWGLRTLRLDAKERKPEVYFDLPGSNEFGSAFSPDGKWIAYASNASADATGNPTAFAIYVQPYPPTGVKYQISSSGGAWPTWAANGAELLYRLNVQEGGAPRINAVTITTTPVPAFTTERVLTITGFQPVVNYREYDVFPNGRELVMVFPASRTQSADAPTARIHAVLNWFEELKRRVPAEQR